MTLTTPITDQPDTHTIVLGVDNISCPSGQAVLETALSRRPGVQDVTANWATQTAAVRYDPTLTNAATLSRWIDEGQDTAAPASRCPST